MSGRKRKILLVEDVPAIVESLATTFSDWGFEVMGCSSDESLNFARSYSPDIVISDVVLSEISRLQLQLDFRKGEPSRTIVMIGPRSNNNNNGSSSGHPPSFPESDLERLRLMLDDAGRDIELRQKSLRLAGRAEPGGLFPEFAASSPDMQTVFNTIEMVAPRDVPVIITGESGTGKELVARAIHRLGPRSGNPFVAINAAAIPETLIESEVFGHERGSFTGAVGTRPGCFEQAQGGTLFLDEIAEMPLALQPKLLRVLADGKVRRLGGNQEFAFDVRVIAAMNRDPEQAIREGRLREDLYYRLSVIPIELPPLRRRPADVLLLAQRFVSEFNVKHQTSIEGLSEEAASLLRGYAWPGNVRELRNIVERAVLVSKSKWIEIEVLPAHLKAAPPVRQLTFDIGEVTLAAAEREILLRTLEASGNNKTEAARRLGLDVKTVYNKLRSYGME